MAKRKAKAAAEPADQLDFLEYFEGRLDLNRERADLNERASQLRRAVGERARQFGFKMAESLANRVRNSDSWTVSEARDVQGAFNDAFDAWAETQNDGDWSEHGVTAEAGHA